MLVSREGKRDGRWKTGGGCWEEKMGGEIGGVDVWRRKEHCIDGVMANL